MTTRHWGRNIHYSTSSVLWHCWMGIPTFMAQMIGIICGHWPSAIVKWNNLNSVTRVHRMTDRWIIKCGKLPDGRKIKSYWSINHVSQQWRIHSCHAVIDDVLYLCAEIWQLFVNIRLYILVKLSLSLKCNAIYFQYRKFYYFLQTYNNENNNKIATHKLCKKNRLWSLYSSASHKNMVIIILYSFVK